MTDGTHEQEVYDAAVGPSELNVGLDTEPTVDEEFIRRTEWEKSELETERARFEVAFSGHIRTRSPDGRYVYAYVKHAFDGWVERAFAEFECRSMK